MKEGEGKMIDRDKIGWRGIFNRGCFTDDFEATVLEISPSGDRVKIQYENGNTAWRKVEDLTVKEWLNKTQPPPEEKLEIGDTVEILGCNCKPGSHGLGGILRRFGICDYDVWLPWSKRTCIAYKVRFITKPPPEEKLEIGDTVEILKCKYGDKTHEGETGKLRKLYYSDYPYVVDTDSSKTGVCCATKVRLISKAPPASPLTPQQVRGSEQSRTTSSGQSEPNSLDGFLEEIHAVGSEIPILVSRIGDEYLSPLGKYMVKQAVDRWLESLKGRLRVAKEDTDDILSKLQQKIREVK